MVRSASEIVAKQQEKAIAAAGLYAKNVASPERDPVQAALAANDKRVNKLKESIEKKTWEERMRRLPAGYVSKKAAEIGAPRYAQGVEANKDKVDDFWAKQQPLLDAHQKKIDAMPQATDADREKRMLENLRGMRALKGKAR
jgi:hypothetical protein